MPETIHLDSDLLDELIDGTGNEVDGYRWVATVNGESGRWSSGHTMVVRRLEDGKLFGVDYRLGSDGNSSIPWRGELLSSPRPGADLYEVTAHQITRTVYRRAT